MSKSENLNKIRISRDVDVLQVKADQYLMWVKLL